MQLPKKVKVITTKKIWYRPDEFTANKVYPVGTVLEIKSTVANELIHSKKAVSYTGKKSHLEVDETFTKEEPKPAKPSKLGDQPKAKDSKQQNTNQPDNQPGKQ